ncbi:unnamed protein product, partial [marine sediment metagenome]
MEFRLAEGPWESVFSGSIKEYEAEVLLNPDSVLLVAIYEKQKEKRVGAVIQLFKVFYAVGELGAFVETLPKEALAVTRHSKEETMSFLLLGTKPSYAEYKEEAFSDEVDALHKALGKSAAIVKEVSMAYDIKLKPVAKCVAKIRTAFFAQPLMVPLMATAYHPTEAAPAVPAAVAAAVSAAEAVPKPPARIAAGEVLLGLTKDGTVVKEPLTLFGKTFVFSSSE